MTTVVYSTSRSAFINLRAQPSQDVANNKVCPQMETEGMTTGALRIGVSSVVGSSKRTLKGIPSSNVKVAAEVDMAITSKKLLSSFSY